LLLGAEWTVERLVGVQLADDAGHLGLALAVVAPRLDRVVPGAEIPQQTVGLLLGLGVLEHVLALLDRLLCLRLHLVEESHDASWARAPPVAGVPPQYVTGW
jgi:hypothetical protein